MRDQYRVIASLEGYQGERLLAHKVKGNYIYMTVEEPNEETKEAEWYELKYKREKDGVYNQSVKRIQLPYVVYKKDVYSISKFYEWKRR